MALFALPKLIINLIMWFILPRKFCNCGLSHIGLISWITVDILGWILKWHAKANSPMLHKMQPPCTSISYFMWSSTAVLFLQI
ncbi:hypothetical protein XELAEV_18047150mg [Xenopus laevis]|uniref:Uncharacterized protein n=1 Tax=Xenopus laevis TaxID=8355 RepID=A0A974H190_XENLA|nr:hypothetical protein XELAEV_18047150mg [Xenopus laevis]